MLVEDQEGIVAEWRLMFVRLLGFLILVPMVGILVTLIIALVVLTFQRWRRIRRKEANGAKRTPPGAGMTKPTVTDGK